MVAGGNVTYTCKQCGCTFTGWASDKRTFCSIACSYAGVGELIKKHGESRSRLYQIWLDMKNRCYCKTSPSYEYYGARGITICDEWRTHYLAFRAWSHANGYTATLEIDRIDTNGDYEPGNCRWATRGQQMCNTRKRRDAQTSKFRGVSWCSNVGKWRAQINKDKSHYHIGLYKTEVEAAIAYDKAAIQMHGAFASLNFPAGQHERIGVPS